MDQKSLFRKAAIDKLASPEQLDALMKVTSPTGWLALLTVGGLLVGVIVWSIIGTIPPRVGGEGILAAGEFFPVDADANGPLSEIRVQEGDVVAPGTIVATIRLDDLGREVENAGSIYTNAKNSYDRISLDHRSNVRGWNAELERVRGFIDDSLAEKAVQEGRIDDPNYAQRVVLANISQLDERIGGYQSRIDGIERNKRASNDRVEQSRIQMDQAETRWIGLEANQSNVAQVTTAVGGEVIAVNKKVGDTVSPREVVLRILQMHDGGMEALFYVNSVDATQIREGDLVEISPTGSPREEFGFLKGEVIDRSDDVITPAQLVREVGNEARANDILRSGPKRRVRARLYAAGTPTGYQWSSGEGYSERLESVSRVHDVTVNVIVDSKHPYQLVIPIVTAAIGG